MLPRFVWFTFVALFCAWSAAGEVQLTNAFPALTFTRPLLLTHAGDGSNRIFVVQQDGLIKVFPNDTAVASATTFLNITNKLSSTVGEEGLLGLAFHPDYETNGYFYVNYTTPSPLRTVVARYSVRADDPNKADSLSEFVLFTVNQPYSNHNGGMVLFGMDGYLYIGMGDGGSAGDPQNNAQNLQSLLGKMLRIDVDTTTGGRNYAIPPTNPFYENPTEGREEIYGWGFRNPWRFSEDTTSGLMLIGDVGQNAWEEIDVMENGLNYGWRCYEGNVPYNTSGCGPITDYTFPIKVYAHSSGNCSITGGYIYRGYRRPELTGAYIYGDYCTGRIWLLRYENGQTLADSLLIDAPFAISSFGVDQDEELYICNYSGNIQRFVGFPPNDPPSVFDLLSPPDDTTFVFDGFLPLVTFAWEESIDPDLDLVEYTMEFDTSATFGSPAFRDTLAGTATSLEVDFPRQTLGYYWRVRASDGIASVLSTQTWRVNIAYLNDPPSAFNLIFPPSDTTIVVSDVPVSVEFQWEAASDPDGDALTYTLQIDTSASFDSPALRDSIAGGSTIHVVVFEPSDAGAYYWRVLVTDGIDTVSSDEVRVFAVEFVDAVAADPDVPEESSLEQNFPNPFNPFTIIKYTLPQSGFVRLTVFNLLGQTVKVLHEGFQSAGTYEVEFYSAEVPSGIYFYRIESPGFLETKKMVVAK
jgi:glucose/arabinose dehydrogenase